MLLEIGRVGDLIPHLARWLKSVYSNALCASFLPLGNLLFPKARVYEPTRLKFDLYVCIENSPPPTYLPCHQCIVLPEPL